MSADGSSPRWMPEAAGVRRRRASVANLLSRGQAEEIAAALVGVLANGRRSVDGGIRLPAPLWRMVSAMVAARVELRDRAGQPITWLSLREDLRFDRYVMLAINSCLSDQAAVDLEAHLLWLGVEQVHVHWLQASYQASWRARRGAPAQTPDTAVGQQVARLRERHDNCLAVLQSGGELPLWDAGRSPIGPARPWRAAARVGAGALLVGIGQWSGVGPVGYLLGGLPAAAGALRALWPTSVVGAACGARGEGVLWALAALGTLADAWLGGAGWGGLLAQIAAGSGWLLWRWRAARTVPPVDVPTEGAQQADDSLPAVEARQAVGEHTDSAPPTAGDGQLAAAAGVDDVERTTDAPAQVAGGGARAAAARFFGWLRFRRAGSAVPAGGRQVADAGGLDLTHLLVHYGENVE